MSIIIADSGSTKCEWSVVTNGKKKSITTTGMSPYFMNKEQIVTMLQKELQPKIKNAEPTEVHYYGTGISNPENVKILKGALKVIFPTAKTIKANSDLLAAARALCGHEKGIACILGTGANSCYYNGKKIVSNSPGLGYVLGDEGSGAYLGKKVIQYYLYNTFDEDLKASFEAEFETNSVEILDAVYRKPYPNRYLAGFTKFLSNHRGHYMVENILEDGLNDFFFYHLNKYPQSWTSPINFVGSISFVFKDVIKELAGSYELELGKVLKTPMEGLIKYHQQ